LKLHLNKGKEGKKERKKERERGAYGFFPDVIKRASFFWFSQSGRQH